MTQPLFIAITDELVGDIASGKLRPGDRLTPQRIFAYQRGIAPSTAARVYQELLRRGLVVGEVGRGTFVAGEPANPGAIGGEPRDGRIDLDFNFSFVPGQAALMTRSLAGLQRADVLDAAIRPITMSRLETARTIAANFLATPRWTPSPDRFLFTAGGRQALSAAIAALVPIGGRLGVEATTYPLVKSICARQGVTMVPIAMDDEGIRPDALAAAYRASPFSAVYVQPVLHNPLGCSMQAGRRRNLVRMAEALDIVLIEDQVYGFLADAPPLASHAPDRCIVIDSLSKRLAPGIGFGLLHVPGHLQERIATTIRAGAWAVSGLALDIGMRMISDGLADEIQRQKREDAPRRQRIVRECLGAFKIQADERCYHAWIVLPERWRSEAFATAAALAGIALTASSAFTVVPGHAPNAIRLALGLPTHEDLRVALERLRRLLETSPDDVQMGE